MTHQSAYKISILKPCHEDWDKMTQAERGKFCDACQKNVIDFTRLSDNEIVKIIEQTNGNMCGRFSPSQLNREIYIEKYNTFIPLKARLIGGLLALATLQPVISNAAKPKAVEVNIGYSDSSAKAIVPVKAESPTHDTISYTIKGVVVEADNGQSIPFANINVIGTNIYAVSDIDGKFSITVNGPCTLKISSVGYSYTTVEVKEKDLKTEKYVSELFICQLQAPKMMGATVITIRRGYESRENITINKPTDSQIQFFLDTNR